jgi:hypothetical protein
MPRNSKDFTYDHALLLKDAGALTSSANSQVSGQARVLDLGAGRVDGRVVLDVSAIDTVTGDESYIAQVQVSNSATFASGVVAIASKQLGGATPTGNTVATPIGRYEVHFSNEENGVLYRYARLRWVIAGTTPSVNAVAFAVLGTR